MCKVVGNLKYYNIKGQTPESQISLVYRRDRHLTKKARELMELIKKHIDKGENPYILGNCCLKNN